MDSQLAWFFGTCVTGFLFLASWVLQLSLRLSAVTEMKQNIGDIKHDVSAIHLILVGDMDKEGLITRVHKIKEQCEIRHGKKNG